MVAIPTVKRPSALAILIAACILAGCVEKRLPVRVDDQPGPYQSVLLDVRGNTDNFARFGDVRPPAGKMTLNVESVSGDLSNLQISVQQTLACQRKDEIPTERVTVIERIPVKELLAPTLLGIVGTAAGLGWSAYGLTMYDQLPQPSPAASSNERRQDQLLQVTLPLTTLGVSLVLVAIPMFAGIDGAERVSNQPRLGGPDRWEACAASSAKATAKVSSGFFKQAVSSETIEFSGRKIRLDSINLSGAVERLPTIGRACVENCAVKVTAYRPLTVAEKKARIEKTRASLVRFLEQIKSFLQGDRARSSIAYQKALNETTRVALRVNDSQGISLDTLAKLLEAAGEPEKAKDARETSQSYLASLPSAAPRIAQTGPRYVPVRPVDRLVSAPWTCIQATGLNAFELNYELNAPPEGVRLNQQGELCFDWSRYAPTEGKISQLRQQVAVTLLKDTVANAVVIRQALRGELVLQKQGAVLTAPSHHVARALTTAAREYGYYHKGGHSAADLETMLRHLGRRQAESVGSETAMVAFRKAFPDAAPPAAVEGDTP